MRRFIAILLIATPACAEPYRAPRTAWRAPDLEGVWDGNTATPLQRAAKHFKARVATAEEVTAHEGKRRVEYERDVAPLDPTAPAPTEGKVEDDAAQWGPPPPPMLRLDGSVRASLIVDPEDGQLPYTSAGQKLAAQAQRDEEESFFAPEVRPPDERCLYGGGGTAPLINGPLTQIVQTPGHIVLSIESNHDVRIIPIGAAHKPAAVADLLGDSIGRWEGETLVVETLRFNASGARHWNHGDYVMISPQARLTERFTRTSPTAIRYEFTVEDAANYSRPWRAETQMVAARGPVYEYGCHEGNYALRNILAGGRENTPAAAAK